MESFCTLEIFEYTSLVSKLLRNFYRNFLLQVFSNIFRLP